MEREGERHIASGPFPTSSFPACLKSPARFCPALEQRNSDAADAVGKPRFPPTQVAMFVAGSLLIFAAVASQRSALSSRSASLSVSAQVVRPAEVSDPVLTSYGAVVAIRNAEQATVTVDDGTVRQTDAGNKVVELRPGASATITLKY